MPFSEKQPKLNNDSLRTRLKVGFYSVLAAVGITGLVMAGIEISQQGNRSYLLSGGYCPVAEHGYNPEGSKVIWAGKERSINSVHRTVFNGYNSVICELDGANILLDTTGMGIEFVISGSEAFHKETGTILFAVALDKPDFLLNTVSEEKSKELFAKYGKYLISAGNMMRLTPDSLVLRDLGLTFSIGSTLVLAATTIVLGYKLSDRTATLENANKQLELAGQKVKMGNSYQGDNEKLKQQVRFWREKAEKAEQLNQELNARPVPVRIVSGAAVTRKK